jgi:hypothetical protein
LTINNSLANEDTGPQAAAPGAIAIPFTPARWLRAAIRTTRPRQWPKNLLVFAAPLAAASFGRSHGFYYALVAMVAFACASAAVYFINDVVDVERDRRHPVKRNRPIASGALPERHSLGALGVAIAKRYTELTSLGEDAVRYRPVMRWYRPGMLRVRQPLVGLGLLTTYLMWAA